MFIKSALSTALIFGLGLSCIAQEEPKSKPIELEVLKSSIGVWDADIEVWPEGLESSSIKFKGVEKNRPYGEYWIASDFDSEFQGQTMKVHSIIGYDPDQKRMVGMNIDHGPYAAKMTGDYDVKSKTVRLSRKAMSRLISATGICAPTSSSTTPAQTSSSRKAFATCS